MFDAATRIALTEQLLADVSNWGRWGSDDRLGTLNLLTPAIRAQAAQLIQSGQVCALARRLGNRAERDNPNPLQHFMLRSGTEATAAGFATSADWIALSFHGFGTTHLDALSHVFWNGQMYNGRPAALVTVARGATAHSIEDLAAGVTGRGVLLDVPRFRGVEWLEFGEEVAPDELEACAERQGVTLRTGDVVLVRTGRDARRAARGAHDPFSGGSPGLAAECARWLHRHEIAALGGDAAQDVMYPNGAPHLMPIHVTALVGMGMPLLDNAYLEELATLCARRGQWEFFFTLAPLPLQNTTGSPVNPLAIF
jgi:kynurenine formamidase